MARKRRSNGQGTLFQRVDGGPWMAAWYDYAGKRRERSTRTTDRRAAERILTKHVADSALRREGVIDVRQDRFATENRTPLAKHVADYIAHCRRAEQADKHVLEKVRHLDRMLAGTGATRISELTADALERHLHGMAEAHLSARTVNFARQIAVAFMAWAKRTGRMAANPLVVVPKLDERKDRRLIRRPLTDEEIANLMAVADDAGRKAWYMAAAMAGLRKGDLQRLKWADIDFKAGTITVTDGKAQRTDVIHMHEQLAEELLQLRNECPALPLARVFPHTVTNMTRQKDFLRAGLAHRQVVTDANGEPVMIGRGKWRHARTRIVTEDAEGRVIDLHALRTTLGTNLARAGVAPQVAMQIMRHSDYKTTLKHYTVLGLQDTAKAIDRLPRIEGPQREAATGTMGAEAQQYPQQYPQQLGRESTPNSATGRTEGPIAEASSKEPQPFDRAASCQAVRPGGKILTDNRGRSSMARAPAFQAGC